MQPFLQICSNNLAFSYPLGGLRMLDCQSRIATQLALLWVRVFYQVNMFLPCCGLVTYTASLSASWCSSFSVHAFFLHHHYDRPKQCYFELNATYDHLFLARVYNGTIAFTCWWFKYKLVMIATERLVLLLGIATLVIYVYWKMMSFESAKSFSI